jgi:SAM-dependent methyltransferase
MNPIVRRLSEPLRRLWALRPLHPRTCPICGFKGNFGFFGRPPRIDARCPSCASLERHRLFWLWFEHNRSRMIEPVLHFAPEAIFEGRFRTLFQDYRTADLMNPRCDLKLNIEAIELPSESIGTIICNHVLEHVDDAKALAELSRILKPGGIAILSMPLIDGWEKSYEPAGIEGEHMRELHFGQFDHVRYYGRDIRERLAKAPFRFEEITAEGADVITYGLMRGEKMFVCFK